jgi:hypothetical protein
MKRGWLAGRVPLTCRWVTFPNGCARRSPTNSSGDAGSTPATSTTACSQIATRCVRSWHVSVPPRRIAALQSAFGEQGADRTGDSFDDRSPQWVVTGSRARPKGLGLDGAERIAQAVSGGAPPRIWRSSNRLTRPLRGLRFAFVGGRASGSSASSSRCIRFHWWTAQRL